jgi:hypothetical protein
MNDKPTKEQEECDHDWKFRDDSFDHEYGTERQRASTRDDIMKLLTNPEEDVWACDFDFAEYARKEAFILTHCTCAGCGRRIWRTGAFWRWRTLKIVTCESWECFEAYRDSLQRNYIYNARENVLSKCDRKPREEFSKNGPTLQEFIDRVLPIR